MKIPISWLKEYVPLVVSPAELAEKLTMAGIEVGEMQVIGDGWDNVVVGQITAIDLHPNADRLTLPTVDLGTEWLTVVCGAPNLRIGDKVAFARVGARLIDGHSGESIVLKLAKIRGVASSGMVCSEKELGISDSHEGILVLPPEAPVGTPLAEYLGDVILDLEVTTNRPDCLSVIGVAREVAALTEQQVTLSEPDYTAGQTPIGERVSIEVVAPDLCPRYSASLITNVKIAESPSWLKQRLLACGTRPINNVVDITNYVMYEYGQPLHAFDYDLIRGRKIIVRRANAGEPMLTLDGVQRTLTDRMLVISDSERAIALAGVMGGEDIEVTGGTTTILLESASFNPASIHYTSRSLSLMSEASTRYARGASPEITIPALKRATQLIVELAGGEAAAGTIDIYPGKKERPSIRLTNREATRVLGIDFGIEKIAGTLESLGFECQVSEDEVTVRPPYWRSDVSISYDLIEEVARVIGYDRIPLTMLSQPIPEHETRPDLEIKKKLEDSLVGYGFQEIVSISLTGRESLDGALAADEDNGPAPVRIKNPMTADQEYLRTGLRAGLLTALAANQRHEEGAIRLFELGRIYLHRPNDLPEQPEVLCGLMSGPRADRSWLGSGENVDFYDAKGVVEGLFSRLGVPVRFEPGRDNGLHPRKQAALIVNGEKVGVVGELHPEVSLAFELTRPTYLFELELAALIPLVSRKALYQPIPRFPAVVRDIALIVAAGITHQQVADIIGTFPLVSRIELFDVYSGQPVPPGRKSLAYRLVFQSLEHTLTDKGVDKVQQQILERLTREVGASVRSG